jgi:hypothetical protein
MNSGIFTGVAIVFFFMGTALGVPMTEIVYETTDLGSGRWQYTYDVTNIDLSVSIEEFTIWFDYGLYDNLAVETPDPPASSWDEIVWEPEPVLEDDGGYDAQTSGLGIDVGETVSGFAVSFDWLGTGAPGSQFYEIIDPSDYHTIDSGMTVPEPATLFLLGIGGFVLLRKR